MKRATDKNQKIRDHLIRASSPVALFIRGPLHPRSSLWLRPAFVALASKPGATTSLLNSPSRW
jgi:hypothetical protein